MTIATSPMPSPGDAAHPEHAAGYATYVKVWIALLLLTAALVVVSSLGSPMLAVLGLLVITPTKVSLVFLYFMHLREESTTLKYMVAIAMAVLIIFIFLTFADYVFR
jgi:caa(3)-type oxidase subunit IV